MNKYTEDKLAQVLKYGWCEGGGCKGENPADEDHECPFASEIRNDNSPCNCCDYCYGKCSYDI